MNARESMPRVVEAKHDLDLSPADWAVHARLGDLVPAVAADEMPTRTNPARKSAKEDRMRARTQEARAHA